MWLLEVSSSQLCSKSPTNFISSFLSHVHSNSTLSFFPLITARWSIAPDTLLSLTLAPVAFITFHFGNLPFTYLFVSPLSSRLSLSLSLSLSGTASNFFLIYILPFPRSTTGAVEYIDCFSAERQDPLHECPGYDTKQSDD